jgi:hypothetical protein
VLHVALVAALCSGARTTPPLQPGSGWLDPRPATRTRALMEAGRLRAATMGNVHVEGWHHYRSLAST